MKTGKQVFEELILANLNRDVSVSGIVSQEDGTVVFTVCGTKWMAVGQKFTLGDCEWTITDVDYDTQTVTATTTNPCILERNNRILIQAPTFLSGTPRDLNGENKLRDRAGVPLTMPLVWLHESVSGTESLLLEDAGVAFDFTFYCLTGYNAADWLNDDRHRLCIYPMTQLRHGIIEAVDTSYDIKRTERSTFTEFSKFGREAETGFTKYILDLNLSGVECRMATEVDRDACNC